MEIEKDTDLPRNLVKKIVKAKVSQVQASTGAQLGRDIQVNKDALLAFSESAKVREGIFMVRHRLFTAELPSSPLMSSILASSKMHHHRRS